MFPLQRYNMSNLKCYICERYLSVPPIYMVQGKSICGRCEPAGDRVLIYEELAKYMSFPCINDSCKTQLSCGQVANHEINCPYQTVACPKHNCGTYYKANELYQHFRNFHRDLLGVNNFTKKRRLRDMPIKQFNKDRNVYFIHHEDQPYLLMVYGTCSEDPRHPTYIGSYSYCFGVFYLYQNENTKTRYDLTVSITTNNDDIVTDYNWCDEPLRQYNHNVHCLGCLDNNCYLGHAYNRQNFLWNRIDNLENEGISFVVNFTLKLLNEKASTGPACSPANASVAAKLECPICYEYLSAPIFICEGGHSICSECKKRMPRCGLCKAVIGKSRNYTLEEISGSLEICCPNGTRGCQFSGLIKNVKRHLSSCLYN